MTCRKFMALRRAIEKECNSNAIFCENTINYVVNKVSRKISRAKFDIYDVQVSMDNFADGKGRYMSYFSVKFNGGTMFVSLVVD